MLYLAYILFAKCNFIFNVDFDYHMLDAHSFDIKISSNATDIYR